MTGRNKDKMTLRHAAALALVGWYLMVPPARDRPIDEMKAAQTEQRMSMFPEFHLPIAQLEIDEAFDSAKECKEALYQQINSSPKLLTHNPSAYAEYDLDRWTSAKCIATDDPRLKGE
jgi:hypothetical protein